MSFLSDTGRITCFSSLVCPHALASPEMSKSHLEAGLDPGLLLTIKRLENTKGDHIKVVIPSTAFQAFLIPPVGIQLIGVSFQDLLVISHWGMRSVSSPCHSRKFSSCSIQTENIVKQEAFTIPCLREVNRHSLQMNQKYVSTSEVKRVAMHST